MTLRTIELLDRLWRNNWLNVYGATQVAKTRKPPKLYIAVELANTVIDNNTGGFYPNAIEALKFIKSSAFCHVLISTYLSDEYVDTVIKSSGLKVDWVNANPHFDTQRPFYDCYIDSAAGFSPKEWEYVFEIFRMVDQELKDASKIRLLKI